MYIIIIIIIIIMIIIIIFKYYIYIHMCFGLYLGYWWVKNRWCVRKTKSVLGSPAEWDTAPSFNLPDSSPTLWKLRRLESENHRNHRKKNNTICLSLPLYIYIYITLHYITLHYTTLHYIHYITLHYITLHYITLHIHTDTHTPYHTIPHHTTPHHTTHHHTIPYHIYIYTYDTYIMLDPNSNSRLWNWRVLYEKRSSNWLFIPGKSCQSQSIYSFKNQISPIHLQVFDYQWFLHQVSYGGWASEILRS